MHLYDKPFLKPFKRAFFINKHFVPSFKKSMIFSMILVVVISVIIMVKSNNNNKSGFIETKVRARLSKNPIRLDFNRVIYQAFESIYIVDNSSKVETVKSRLLFLHDLLASIEYASLNISNWPVVVAEVEALYKEAYHHRPIHNEVRNIILQPTLLLDNWDGFKENMIFECVKRYSISQYEIIDALKTASAKSKRYTTIAAQIRETTCETSDELLKIKYEKLQNDLLLKSQ